MAANPPHLLSLPREIRNQIYSYLHKEMKVHNERESTRFNVHEVRLENAPYTSVLLVNSKIYHKYREAACFRELAAVVNIGTSVWKDSAVSVKELDPSALSLVRHVTIVDKLFYQKKLERIEKYIRARMPILRTVRHLSVAGLPTFVEDSNLFSVWPPTHVDTEKHSPTAAFLGLPLAQMAIAKHVEDSDLSEVRYGIFDIPDISELYHEVSTLRLVLYTTDDPKKHAWTPEEGNDYWASRSHYSKYPQSLLNSLSPEEKLEKQAQIAMSSTTLLNWTEPGF